MKVASFPPPIHGDAHTEKKMKVAYIVWAFPVLSETFVLNEIVELTKRGHDVQVFSLAIPSVDIAHDEFCEYKLLDRAHYLLPSPF